MILLYILVLLLILIFPSKILIFPSKIYGLDFVCLLTFQLLKEGEMTPGITTEEYISRRNRLLDLLPENSLAIIAAAPVKMMTDVVPYTFRQDADYLYITGCQQPGGVAVLGHDCGLCLFMPEADSHVCSVFYETMTDFSSYPMKFCCICISAAVVALDSYDFWLSRHAILHVIISKHVFFSSFFFFFCKPKVAYMIHDVILLSLLQG